ncbi:MAG: ABC transporter permease [Lentisphaeria bacterium]|nr:ABC transporter permease [Lentisphaeria bacterium]
MTAGNEHSLLKTFVKRFCQDRIAVAGLSFVVLLVLIAIYAPLLANGQPLMVLSGGKLSFPAWRAFFAPDSPEMIIERFFNYLALFLPLTGLISLIFNKKRVLLCGIAGVVLLIPFLTVKPVIDSQNWHEQVQEIRAKGGTVVTALVAYGPFETKAAPYQPSSKEHWLGTDHAGRDVFARMVFGARVSVIVGLAATAISMIIGTLVGLLAGYCGGRTDLFVMRLVEIVICFPQFLLLLILMSIMLDYGSRQSVLLVIAVIGLFNWTGLCRLVRGEVLKQRSMTYISAAECLGVPRWKILLKHLLPNVSGPIIVIFSFEFASAILVESSLSFLGFGVQDPVSSWGELISQAEPSPMIYWRLILWPGLAIFLSVCAFNFVGEGVRKAIN